MPRLLLTTPDGFGVQCDHHEDAFLAAWLDHWLPDFRGPVEHRSLQPMITVQGACWSGTHVEPVADWPALVDARVGHERLPIPYGIDGAEIMRRLAERYRRQADWCRSNVGGAMPADLCPGELR